MDSAAAREDPEIGQFVELARPEMVDGAVPFGFLQSRETMPFWPRMLISRFDVAAGEYRHIFVGTRIVDVYDIDFTGTLLDAHPEERIGVDILRAIRDEVIRDRTIKYYSGDVLVDSRYAKHWNTACMPYTTDPAGEPAGTVNILSYF